LNSLTDYHHESDNRHLIVNVITDEIKDLERRHKTFKREDFREIVVFIKNENVYFLKKKELVVAIKIKME